MSEEQIKEEKKCVCAKLAVILSIIALLVSMVSLGFSIYTQVGGGGAAGAKDNGKVVISKQYDKGQSLKKAQAKNKPIIVFFYTDWCGFCQRFVPTFHKISKLSKIKKNFAIAYVNCEDTENRNIVEEFAIHGFPTVYVIDSEGKRTQLENNTFFNNDSVEVVSKKALELIGIEED